MAAVRSGEARQQLPIPPDQRAHAQISGWLSSQGLDFATRRTDVPHGALPGRVWYLQVSTPASTRVIPVMLHTSGSTLGVSVLLRAKAGGGVIDVVTHLAKAYPYVRGIADDADGGRDLYVRAEAPLDLQHPTVVLPGTIQQLVSVVLLAVQRVLDEQPERFDALLPETMPIVSAEDAFGDSGSEAPA